MIKFTIAISDLALVMVVTVVGKELTGVDATHKHIGKTNPGGASNSLPRRNADGASLLDSSWMIMGTVVMIKNLTIITIFLAIALTVTTKTHFYSLL